MLYCYRVRSTSLSGPRREGNSWESCFYQSRREKLLLDQEVLLYPWRIYGEGSYRMRSICRLGHSDYDHARQLLRVGCPSGWTQEIAIRGLPLNAMKNDRDRFCIGYYLISNIRVLSKKQKSLIPPIGKFYLLYSLMMTLFCVWLPRSIS